MVEVSLTVGKLDASLALLLTEDHYLIEFPTILLPNDVEAGSIVKISCEKDVKSQKEDDREFKKIQDDFLSSFGVQKPATPVLRVRNVTQTSIVLEWDPIQVATADIISLTLYKNGQRFGLIPTPLKRTATKLSGLAIDNTYTFSLVLTTTAGTFTSDKVTVNTHKMTDLSGLTMCIGDLGGSDITEEELEKIASTIGAKALQTSVRLDTTHFICTKPDSNQYKRAQDWNIPIVRPEWVKACEAERRLVGVRAYYLDADPKLRPPIQRERTSTQGTGVAPATSDGDGIPQLKVTEPEPDRKLQQSVKEEPEKEAEAVAGAGEPKTAADDDPVEKESEPEPVKEDAAAPAEGINKGSEPPAEEPPKDTEPVKEVSTPAEESEPPAEEPVKEPEPEPIPDSEETLSVKEDGGSEAIAPETAAAESESVSETPVQEPTPGDEDSNTKEQSTPSEKDDNPPPPPPKKKNNKKKKKNNKSNQQQQQGDGEMDDVAL